MFHDLLARLRTPLAPHLRALGYLDETLAMRRRARRNAAAWQSHLDNTRRFVLASAEACRDRDTVVVLGSGLLLDVPLGGLATLFGNVVLKDVVCLPEVQKEIGRYGNVRFVEYDVTGIGEQLVHLGRNGAVLPDPGEALAGLGRAGLVVSLNILSQLWVMPRGYASRQLRGVPPEQVDDWCAGIVEAHYRALRGLAGDVCLVGDHAFVKRDREGRVVSRGSTVYGLELPEPDASWTWNIAPLGAGSGQASKELLVGAWMFRAGAG